MTTETTARSEVKSSRSNGYPQLLRTSEVSEQTGIPVATWRWWRHRGEGPRSFKLGRTVFYDATDVAAWIETQKTATARGGAR
ncbi:helix-turn-helix transcriptional regulator [Mycolicibacterium hippocampi]|uniref:helix-turn-helix transcriptional regulator n=1 Tax=Mycolicibacterium hippocampi TaxID=659824 RepID=UPI0013D1BFCF|nr:helix-turn-helix domain-containing protein [Mycolicibacterium hippocampi]